MRDVRPGCASLLPLDCDEMAPQEDGLMRYLRAALASMMPPFCGVALYAIYGATTSEIVVTLVSLALLGAALYPVAFEGTL